MAVIIQNLTAIDNEFDGICTYQVRINRKHFAYFDHLRSEGLATCLRKAADAVELAEKKEEPPCSPR